MKIFTWQPTLTHRIVACPFSPHRSCRLCFWLLSLPPAALRDRDYQAAWQAWKWRPTCGKPSWPGHRDTKCAGLKTTSLSDSPPRSSPGQRGVTRVGGLRTLTSSSSWSCCDDRAGSASNETRSNRPLFVGDYLLWIRLKLEDRDFKYKTKSDHYLCHFVIFTLFSLSRSLSIILLCSTSYCCISFFERRLSHVNNGTGWCVAHLYVQTEKWRKSWNMRTRK